MMAGWITRVVTVTYGAQHARRSDHVPPMRVDVRRATSGDVDTRQVPERVRGYSAGPCGTRARAALTGCPWSRMVEDLRDYVARYGFNPLGASERMGTGAKEGKRGRGSQDYLFR